MIDSGRNLIIYKNYYNMRKNKLNTETWEKAKILIDFFKQDTTCLDADNKLIVDPKYVVALGDDVISVYYALRIVLKARRQFHSFPHILCCGGTGMFSQYLSIGPEDRQSDGEKLHYVARCISLDLSQDISILDKGSNLSATLREIADFLELRGDVGAPIIFCPTQRMSKRLERTVVFSNRHLPEAKQLNDYYYVPGETLEQVLQLYNGKGLANGLPLLSELASLYDRIGTDKYVRKYVEPLDKTIPSEVKCAGLYLMLKYPIRVSHMPLSAPMQFSRIVLSLLLNHKEIEEDLNTKISGWRSLHLVGI